MKTSLDLVDILWNKINGSSLDTAIDGGIYKNQRPADSKTEDIVINSLAMNNEQLQRAVANVNIHVPNKAHVINNIGDSSQPDHARFQELLPLAISVLKNVWVLDYNFDIQQEVLIKDEDTGEYYINIRIDFFNINLS